MTVRQPNDNEQFTAHDRRILISVSHNPPESANGGDGGGADSIFNESLKSILSEIGLNLNKTGMVNVLFDSDFRGKYTQISMFRDLNLVQSVASARLKKVHINILSDEDAANISTMVVGSPIVPLSKEIRLKLGWFTYNPDQALQIAFQYSVVVPLDEPSVPGSSPSQRARYSLKRRLRIRTVKFLFARTIFESFNSVDPEVVLSMLVHEVISSSLEKGVQECRTLLHEWLVNLTTLYNDAYGLGYSCKQHWSPPSYDVTFYNCPRLKPLPRYIFALLQTPLLLSHEECVHPDYQIYLQCLFSSLDPTSLAHAVYPQLVSYETPDQPTFSEHFLSRYALFTNFHPIYFLDAFTTVVVYYSYRTDDTLPLPPPDSLLTTAINKVKRECVIAPKLILIREGKDDATPFYNYLLEDANVGGRSSVGFVSFLREVSHDVAGIRWRTLVEWQG